MKDLIQWRDDGVVAVRQDAPWIVHQFVLGIMMARAFVMFVEAWINGENVDGFGVTRRKEND